MVKISPVSVGEVGSTLGWEDRLEDGEIPWRRAWKSTPAFFLGKSHGQRSLAGYSLRGHKESERLSNGPTAHILLG